MAKTRRTVAFVSEIEGGSTSTTVRSVMVDPEIGNVDDEVIIGIAKFCIQTLNERFGLERAQKLIGQV